ncbi:hypothetical protein LTR85_010161 [Meristemomyces frigidus]|nr:hypothetical protein LTR85_010161 [Meristemomyces frigidus]
MPELHPALRNLHPSNVDPKKSRARRRWPLCPLITVWLMQILMIITLSGGLFEIYQAPKEIGWQGKMNPALKTRLVLLAVYTAVSAFLVLLEMLLRLFGIMVLPFYWYSQWFKFSGALWFAMYYASIRKDAVALHATKLAAYRQRITYTPALAVNKDVHLDPRVLAKELGPIYPSPFLVYMFYFFLLVSIFNTIPAIIFTIRDAGSEPEPEAPAANLEKSPQVSSLSLDGPMDTDPLQHRRRSRSI